MSKIKMHIIIYILIHYLISSALFMLNALSAFNLNNETPIFKKIIRKEHNEF